MKESQRASDLNLRCWSNGMLPRTGTELSPSYTLEMSPEGPQRVSHKKTSFECWSQNMRSWYKEIRDSNCEATLPLRLLRTGRWRRRGAEGRDSPQHVPPTGEEVTHTGVERWLSPIGCGTESQGGCHSGARRGGRKTVESSSLRPEDTARCEQGWLLPRP